MEERLSSISINEDTLDEILKEIITVFIKRKLTLEEALVITTHIPNFLRENSRLEIMP
jgi:hypothetical protein